MKQILKIVAALLVSVCSIAFITVAAAALVGAGKINPRILRESSESESFPESTEEPVIMAPEEEAYSAISAETGFEEITPSVYTYTGTELQECFRKPDSNSDLICKLSSGAKVNVVGKTNGFYAIRLDSTQYAFAPEDMLEAGEMYAMLQDAIDLRALLPEAIFAIDFATDENVTGHALYPAIPFLEEETAFRLREAYEEFLSDGYLLKICDAYRPKSAQYALWDAVRNSNYIADPNSGNSWHNIGRAVDMSLVEISTGREMETPTPMHTFSPDSARYSSGGWTEQARSNIEYMTSVMTSHGFSTIETEWWHFEWQGAGNYLDTEVEYANIAYDFFT